MRLYIFKLFSHPDAIALAAVASAVYTFFFPTPQLLFSALAVLGMFALDLITKLCAKCHEARGWGRAFRTRTINSASFFRGTRDKLIIFAVFTIVGGVVNRITIISELGFWFTSSVYMLMVLRDMLSVVENLTDAGVGGLGIFKRLVKRKMSEYVEPDETENINNTDNNGG
jgi:hypothetical protein